MSSHPLPAILYVINSRHPCLHGTPVEVTDLFGIGDAGILVWVHDGTSLLPEVVPYDSLTFNLTASG